MPMKKCPDCGLPVGDYFKTCPKCGATVGDGADAVEGGTRAKSAASKTGNMRLGVWDLLFLLLCNISFVLIMVNVFTGASCWCHYPVLGLFALCFFAFACAAKTAKRFLTRFRNAVFILNFVAGAFGLVLRAADGDSASWAFDYFIPCSLMLGCIVMLLLTLHPGIPVRNVLFSLALLFLQSTVQFIFMLVGLSAAERISKILIAVAFGVNLLSLIDLAFLYFIKFRNKVTETFRLWE